MAAICIFSAAVITSGSINVAAERGVLILMGISFLISTPLVPIVILSYKTDKIKEKSPGKGALYFPS